NLPKTASVIRKIHGDCARFELDAPLRCDRNRNHSAGFIASQPPDGTGARKVIILTMRHHVLANVQGVRYGWAGTAANGGTAMGFTAKFFSELLLFSKLIRASHGDCAPWQLCAPINDIGPDIGHPVDAAKHPRISSARRLGYSATLMLAARITLPPNSVSAAMNFPNSTAPIGTGTWAISLIRGLTLASMRPALISRLSVSTISAGAPRGATIPTHELASYPGTAPAIGGT